MIRLRFILFTALFLNSTFFIHHASAGVIQLPHTGQTKCYNSAGAEISCAGTGQDGDLRAGVAWPNPRFLVSGNCVTDNLTGLMWSKDGNLAGTRSWQGALDWVDNLNNGVGLCGYTDWRLPNRKELKSLVNRQQSSSAAWLNTQGFISVQGNYYWSSTTYYPSNLSAWVVHMYDGYVYNAEKFFTHINVWPVRSGQ
jgi:hypothetical protein